MMQVLDNPQAAIDAIPTNMQEENVEFLITNTSAQKKDEPNWQLQPIKSLELLTADDYHLKTESSAVESLNEAGNRAQTNAVIPGRITVV